MTFDLKVTAHPEEVRGQFARICCLLPACGPRCQAGWQAWWQAGLVAGRLGGRCPHMLTHLTSPRLLPMGFAVFLRLSLWNLDLAFCLNFADREFLKACLGLLTACLGPACVRCPGSQKRSPGLELQRVVSHCVGARNQGSPPRAPNS